MRRDDLYLSDIIEASDSAAAFLANIKEHEFVGNDLLRSAVLQKLMVIGEAAGRISAELRNRHPEIPWPEIVAFRNIAIHAYFSVKWPVVWAAATTDIPALRSQIAEVLRAEAPGDTP
ncbi:hypothetical protein RAS1_27020 [Phycisphaerae bacterium RAS1]|nr:hypothetical protein RAS1_27020 [Phycisphaerae bacterium RAS1]